MNANGNMLLSNSHSCTELPIQKNSSTIKRLVEEIFKEDHHPVYSLQTAAIHEEYRRPESFEQNKVNHAEGYLVYTKSAEDNVKHLREGGTKRVIQAESNFASRFYIEKDLDFDEAISKISDTQNLEMLSLQYPGACREKIEIIEYQEEQRESSLIRKRVASPEREKYAISFESIASSSNNKNAEITEIITCDYEEEDQDISGSSYCGSIMTFKCVKKKLIFIKSHLKVAIMKKKYFQKLYSQARSVKLRKKLLQLLYIQISADKFFCLAFYNKHLINNFTTYIIFYHVI